MDYVLIAFVSQVLVFFTLIVAYEAKRKFQAYALKVESKGRPETVSGEAQAIWRKAS